MHEEEGSAISFPDRAVMREMEKKADLATADICLCIRNLLSGCGPDPCVRVRPYLEKTKHSPS